MVAVIACFLMGSPAEVRADGPLQRLRDAKQDNRELVRLSNEDAAQARRDNIERLRSSGPSSSRSRCSSSFSVRQQQLLLLQSSSQPSVLLFRLGH